MGRYSVRPKTLASAFLKARAVMEAATPTQGVVKVRLNVKRRRECNAFPKQMAALKVIQMGHLHPTATAETKRHSDSAGL